MVCHAICMVVNVNNVFGQCFGTGFILDKRSKQMDAKVITRYIVLILALVNQFLANKGISPIPVDDETISSIILTVVALYTTYKDNPTSQEGKWANQS